MPLPTPMMGESEDEFASRCIEELMEKDEAADTAQAAAICYEQWEGRDMEQGERLQRVERVQLYGQIQRVDEDERMVYGVATTETPVEDYPGMRVVLDYDATVRAADAWRKWGNIREMHQPSAVGVAQEIEPRDAERDLFIGAKVVDDAAWQKVKEGVYRGFSINAQPERWEEARDDDIVRVTEYEIVEVSLVDRPHDPAAVITLWRRKPEGESGMTALERFWRSEMGDADIPDDPEEIKRMLSVKLEIEYGDGDEDSPAEGEGASEAAADAGEAQEMAPPERIARLEQYGERLERLGGRLDGVKDLIGALTARVARLESQPAPLPVAPTGPAEKPLTEQIEELKRVIAEKRLAPESPEVKKLLRLYERARSGQ
jgi:phage head maturation protease